MTVAVDGVVTCGGREVVVVGRRSIGSGGWRAGDSGSEVFGGAIEDNDRVAISGKTCERFGGNT